MICTYRVFTVPCDCAAQHSSKPPVEYRKEHILENTEFSDTNARPSGLRISGYEKALADAAIYQAEAVQTLLQTIAERARKVIAALACAYPRG